MEESNQNPYDFILNNQNLNLKKSFLQNTSLKKRLIIVIVGGLFVLTLFGVLYAAILGGGNNDAKQLYQVVAAQQDLIDLTKLGTTEVRDHQIINQSMTTYLIVVSQNNSTKEYMGKRNLNKSSTAKIAAYRDTSFKKVLDEAKDNGKYDESYQAVYINRVDLYRTKLQSAYASVDGQNLKKLLQSYYVQLNEVVGKR